MYSLEPAAIAARDRSIDRPVMLLGTGRSGTTLMLALMGCHPQLAWISQYTNRFPAVPELALLSRVLDIEEVTQRIPWSGKFKPRPVEPNRLLRSVTEGAFWQHRELKEADVDPRVRARYRKVVRRHLHWQGKARFLQKHTGFPRTEYLQAIFPDARFIHVLRDGRAVVNSLLHVDFFDGTMDTWRWGPMRPEYEAEYEASGRAPVVLAAVQWKTLVDLIEPAMESLPEEQSLTIRYDALLKQAEATLAEVNRFCELGSSAVFDERVRRIKVSGSDDQWKRLPRDDRDLLEASLADHLARLGFS